MNPVAGGTHALLKTFLPQKAGITCTFVDIRNVAAVKEAIRHNTVVGLYVF